MSIRIYELAKELNIDSKILMALCHELDIYLKTHMTQLDDECEELLRAAYRKPHPLVAAHLEKLKTVEDKKQQLETVKLEREKKKQEA